MFKVQTFPVYIASHFSSYLPESCPWPIIQDLPPENYSNTLADKNIYGLFLYKSPRDNWKQLALAPQSINDWLYLFYFLWLLILFFIGVLLVSLHSIFILTFSWDRIEAFRLQAIYNRSPETNRSSVSIPKAKGWFCSLLPYHGLQNPLSSSPSLPSSFIGHSSLRSLIGLRDYVDPIVPKAHFLHLGFCICHLFFLECSACRFPLDWLLTLHIPVQMSPP